jgi:hypothetical protein
MFELSVSFRSFSLVSFRVNLEPRELWERKTLIKKHHFSKGWLYSVQNERVEKEIFETLITDDSPLRLFSLKLTAARGSEICDVEGINPQRLIHL